MEEEDKDAFQEEERAGESFLQPSSKSRSEKILQKRYENNLAKRRFQKAGKNLKQNLVQ